MIQRRQVSLPSRVASRRIGTCHSTIKALSVIGLGEADPHAMARTGFEAQSLNPTKFERLLWGRAV